MNNKLKSNISDLILPLTDQLFLSKIEREYIITLYIKNRTSNIESLYNSISSLENVTNFIWCDSISSNK
jgi:hypothetical protein